MLEFRTGSGSRFTVLVDRAMDIAECEYKARPCWLPASRPSRNTKARTAWLGRGRSQASWANRGRTFRAGPYALGIEPSTHHAPGDLAARERGEMIWLERGMSRATITWSLRVLDGAQEIAEAESEIRRAAAQPQEDYPQPTGDFMPLGGAMASQLLTAGEGSLARLPPRRARCRKRFGKQLSARPYREGIPTRCRGAEAAAPYVR